MIVCLLGVSLALNVFCLFHVYRLYGAVRRCVTIPTMYALPPSDPVVLPLDLRSGGQRAEDLARTALEHAPDLFADARRQQAIADAAIRDGSDSES